MQPLQASELEQRPAPLSSPFAGVSVVATTGITTAFGFFPSPSLSSPASTSSHIPSPASSLSSSASSCSSSSSPSAVATSFFHFPPAPSPPPPITAENGDRRGVNEDDFSQVVDLCVRSLDPPLPSTGASPTSRRLSSPLSSSAHSLLDVMSAPVSVSPHSQWQAGGRQLAHPTHPVRSRLRASAPPFQLRSPSSVGAGNSSTLRFPSASFPVLPSQLSPHEQHWSNSDTRKIGLDGGSSGMTSLSSSPLHSFTVGASAALRAPTSPIARRPITPGLSSTLNVLSAPFAPSSAPTQSRSLRDAHRMQQLVTTPVTPHSTLLYSPLLTGGTGMSSSTQLSSSTALSAFSPSSTSEESVFSFVPQLPFDLPSDRDFLHELPKHAMYMFAFRTSVCPLYRTGNCPSDAYTCFYAHSKLPRRRAPILHHGRYNYIPTRCRYLLEDRECPKGTQCRFAHVTEEVIYHPSKYKTQLCSHPTDENGCCTGYGMHCAKAHSDEDRRHPVYEIEEGQPRRWTADNFYDFQCPPEEREQEHLYYLYRYKTQRCAGYPYNCQCDGLDWHREEERRRGPAIRYAPMACPNVKPYINAEWGDPNIDCSGKYAAFNAAHGRVVQWDCDYAHTLLELMYHPQVFKTQLCVAAGSVVTMGCGGGLEVERVKVGDTVMAWDAEKGGLVRTEVLGVIEREDEKECVEVTFEDGRMLRCTPDHLLLTEDGKWLEAQKLTTGESRVLMCSIPSVLFPSSEHEKDDSETWTMRLCGDERYHFSCVDLGSCFRSCALARIIGLSIISALEVCGDDEDEATWQCSIRRETRLDAERLVADVELVSGEEVELRDEDESFVIVLPPSLVAVLHQCDFAHTPPVGSSSDSSAQLRLPSLLTDIGTPEFVFKECVAAVIGALPQTDVGVDAATQHPLLTFALPVASEWVVDAVHSVVNSVRQRFQIDVQYDSESGSNERLQRLIFPVVATQRIGVRYNTRLELEMAKVNSCIGGAALDSPTGGAEGSTSADLPCYSLALLSRRSCGHRRVFDLQVDSRLHSFVANGVVAHNCDHFRQNDPHSWKCVWKRRCAHAHGQADLKTKEQAMEGWRQHLALIGAIQTLEGDGQTQQTQHPSPLMLPSTQHSEDGNKADGDGGNRAVMRPLLSRWSEDVADDDAWAREKVHASGERERRGSMPLPGTMKGWSESSTVLDKLSTHSPYSGIQQSGPNRRLSLFDLTESPSSSSVWSSPSSSSTSPSPRPTLSSPTVRSEPTRPPSSSSASPSPLALRPSKTTATWDGAAGGLGSLFPVVLSAEQAVPDAPGSGAGEGSGGVPFAPSSPPSPFDGFSLGDISYLSD